MQKINRNDALRMLEEAFGIDTGSLTENIARADLPEWDSMGALMLIAELDARFSIILTPEESKDMTYVRDVLNMLEARGCLHD